MRTKVSRAFVDRIALYSFACRHTVGKACTGSTVHRNAAADVLEYYPNNRCPELHQRVPISDVLRCSRAQVTRVHCAFYFLPFNALYFVRGLWDRFRSRCTLLQHQNSVRSGITHAQMDGPTLLRRMCDQCRIPDDANAEGFLVLDLIT